MKILFSFFFSFICSSQVFAGGDFCVINEGVNSKIPIKIKEGFLTTSTGTEILSGTKYLFKFSFRAISGRHFDLDHNNWPNMDKAFLPKKTKASPSVPIYTQNGKAVEGTLSNSTLNIIATWNIEGNNTRQWAVLPFENKELIGKKKLTLELHNINQTNHLLPSGGQEPCFYFYTTLFGDNEKITSGIHETTKDESRILTFKEIDENLYNKPILNQSTQGSSSASSSGENSSDKASSGEGSSHGPPPSQSPKCKCEIL